MKFNFFKVPCLTIIIFILTIGLQSLYHFKNLSNLEGHWFHYLKETDKKEVLLSQLKAELGYGGMIHNFKNYILRQDPLYYEKTRESLTTIRKTLTQISKIENLTLEEKMKLKVLSEVIFEYAQKNEIAIDLKKGQSIQELDDIVKVDDSAAFESLDWFAKNQKSLKNSATKKFSDNVISARESFVRSVVFSIIVFLCLMIFVFFKMKSNIELSNNNRLLKFSQEETNDGWWNNNLSSKQLYFSPKLWKTFGYDQNEYENNSIVISDVVHKSDRDKFQNILLGRFEVQHDQALETELRFIHKEKHIIYILCRAKIIEYDKNKKAKWIVGSHTDITNLKIIQKELVKQKEVTLQTERLSALGEMSANIAHELNNPLTVLAGSATVIRHCLKKDDIPLEKLHSTANSIETTVNRMTTVINGLKRLARNGDTDEFIEFNLSQLLDEIYPLCRERAIRHDVSLTMPEDELSRSLVVYGRCVQVSQVFLNILNNAFGAVSELEERWIKVEFEDAKDEVMIRISDSGIGVPNDLVEKLMMPFFTTKKDGEGTGIGLSISKSIIENHRGQFYIDTEAPNTTFVFTLPKIIKLERA